MEPLGVWSQFLGLTVVPFLIDGEIKLPAVQNTRFKA